MSEFMGLRGNLRHHGETDGALGLGLDLFFSVFRPFTSGQVAGACLPTCVIMFVPVDSRIVSLPFSRDASRYGPI